MSPALKLSQIVGPEAAVSPGSPDPAVTGISADSRAIRPGYIFAALPGAIANGAQFVPAAVAAGATAILAPSGTAIAPPPGIALITSDEPRRTLALIAARLSPGQPAHVLAITGTNGKTSVADFTRQLFAILGRNAASLGTIGVVSASGAVYGSLTTPDPVTLHQTLDRLAHDGVTHLAMEASSHGLDQFRLDGVKLAAGAFLNLGRDHLDYHPDIEDYLRAKLRLFRELLAPGQPAVVVADAPFAAAANQAARDRKLALSTVGIKGDTLRLIDVTRDGFGQHLTIRHDGSDHRVTLDLIGTYQATNALAAAALAIALGEPADKAIAALATLKGVAGRLELTARHNGGIAIVDYAHKPEALAAALDAVRPFVSGRLVCVMGCGGNRDRGKRPIMGAIAAEKSDIVIVTDDNPRNEDPATIRAEILAGIKPGRAVIREIGDRASAIASAVTDMRAGDVVLVAGKGHETGQIVGATTLPFSDHAAIRAALTNQS